MLVLSMQTIIKQGKFWMNCFHHNVSGAAKPTKRKHIAASCTAWNFHQTILFPKFNSQIKLWQVNPHLKRLQNSPISCNQCKHLCLPRQNRVPAWLCFQQPSHPPRWMFLRFSLNRSTATRKICHVMPVLSKDARLPAGKYKKRTCRDDG